MRRLLDSGYTILEVMIFLAITGVLFASAVVAIGGSQEQAQYSQAVRDFEIQIKDVANDVANGYYPAYDRGSCEQTGGGKVLLKPDNSPGSGEPGTNVDCINVGKTLMFNLDTDEDGFSVATLIGVNPGIGEEFDLSVDALEPIIAHHQNGQGILDLTVSKPIRFGAKVTKIALVNDPAITFSTLSFITDFNSSGSTERTENGTLTTNVYGIRGDLNDNSIIKHYKDEIKFDLEDASSAIVDVNPEEGYYFCLEMNNGRLARVILGVDGVVTATKSEFDLIPGGGIC